MFEISKEKGMDRVNRIPRVCVGSDCDSVSSLCYVTFPFLVPIRVLPIEQHYCTCTNFEVSPRALH